MPRFVLLTLQSLKQAKDASGFRAGSLLADRKLTSWAMTAWDDHAAMRKYMTAGSHKVAMPLLLQWCDEASVVHWDREDGSLPSWQVAAERMRGGRASKDRNPSPDHADLNYRDPRFGGAFPIRAKRVAWASGFAGSAARP